MPLPSEIDVAIIGAGAAGIGAARALEGKGLSVLMLEARDRLGGRAFTRQLENGIIFDVGCGWLHSADRNMFVGIAEKLGFEIDRGRPHWSQQTFNIGFPQEEREAYLRGDGRVLRPRRGCGRRRHRTVRPANCCCPAIAGTRCSTASRPTSTASSSTASRSTTWTPMRTPNSTGASKRGYGALVAAYGAPCPVAFDTRVTLIDHSVGAHPHRDVARHADREQGDRHRADQPDRQRDACASRPALPEKIEAARGLPLGLADKVMLALDDDGDALPKDGHLRGSTTKVGTGSYHLRPQASPASKAISAAASRASWKTPAKARSQPPPSTRSSPCSAPTIAGSCGRSPRHAGRTTRSRPAPTPTRCPATPTTARNSRAPSTAASSSRRSHLAELLLDLPRCAGERDQGGGGGGRDADKPRENQIGQAPGWAASIVRIALLRCERRGLQD